VLTGRDDHAVVGAGITLATHAPSAALAALFVFPSYGHLSHRPRRLDMTTRGQVKWFDPKKGFGFILGPDGQDVFVHYSQIQGDGFRSLKDGEDVDYELTQGDKGFQAREVQRINPPQPAPAGARHRH
jgi:CspA family cold shock protein